MPKIAGDHDTDGNVGEADRVPNIRSESNRLTLDLWAGERFAGHLKLDAPAANALACRLLSLTNFASDQELTEEERAFLHQLLDAQSQRETPTLEPSHHFGA